MAGLLIKSFPRELHRRLKKRAMVNRRSVSREILVILEEALADRSGSPTLAEIDQLRVKGKKLLPQRVINQARKRRRA